MTAINDKLQQFNGMDAQQAKQVLMQMCTSENWCEKLLILRPYEDFNELQATADAVWQGLDEQDYLQAFDGHPKIGDVNSLRAKYANTKTLASNEQAGVNEASTEVLQNLAALNEQYFTKFGFIFIVCATGKSAEQMLALLKQRIVNDRQTELANAAQEQGKIFQLRLAKYFNC